MTETFGSYDSDIITSIKDLMATELKHSDNDLTYNFVFNKHNKLGISDCIIGIDNSGFIHYKNYKHSLNEATFAELHSVLTFLLFHCYEIKILGIN